jgi:glycerol-3-phosphate acyltransferase PlsX
VGLLSNGAEEEKGNSLSRETFSLLRRTKIRFEGYAEGRDIPSGEWDVVVCDGFVGNALLKFGEGLARLFSGTLRKEIEALGARGKAGGVLLRPAFEAMRRRFDYAEYGGAPLLGLPHLAIICHGASPAKALREAARVALDSIRQNLVGKMKEALA